MGATSESVKIPVPVVPVLATKTVLPRSKDASAAMSAESLTVVSPVSAPACAPAALSGSASPLRPEEGTAAVACEDRRITRSKAALRDALIDLMEERGIEGFTVNDLCERANLNRGTFYNHFRDKDDLLLRFENEVLDDLDHFQVKMKDLTMPYLWIHKTKKRPLPLLVELYDYLRDQGDFLHAVLGSRGDGRFGARLRDAVCKNLIESILHERYRNTTEPFVQYYVAFYASAYMGVIMRWIATGMQESSQEMALIAIRLFFIKPGESITL